MPVRLSSPATLYSPARGSIESDREYIYIYIHHDALKSRVVMRELHVVKLESEDIRHHEIGMNGSKTTTTDTQIGENTCTYFKRLYMYMCK